MAAQENNIQSTLLEQVKKRLPANLSFADELGEILHISRDSAYRRIRGETILSLEEVKVLYDHFGISVDELLDTGSEMVTFHRRVVDEKGYNLEKWLNSIGKNLDFLTSFKEHEMIFSAKDVPVFHYFRNPELASFKLFFWMKTLIGYPPLESENYHQDKVPRELMALATKVWTKYAALPSVEIWNEEALYDTLRQIEFYHACGFFDEQGKAIFLCDQLTALIDDVRNEAAVGLKSEGGKFDLYNNEILIADNTVFARMGDKRCVYVNQNALNLLLTFQEPFCQQTETYLRNLIKKSTLISTTAERERNRFFNNMKKRIQELKDRIK